MGASAPNGSVEGVRLLSHRPSVLFKIEHHASGPGGGDIAVEGLRLTGPDWETRLRDLLVALSHAERACLFAVRLDDQLALPVPAQTLLDRSRTDWFPKFLSQGQLAPVFQPIVDLRTGAVYGRDALMGGRLGKGEVRGDELVEAAEAHDALFSFDARARAAALSAGLPRLPEGEVLLVPLDPRAVVDVDSSLRSTWPHVRRAEAAPTSIGLILTRPDRCPDVGLLQEIAAAHREQGAVIALDDLSAAASSVVRLEAVNPDIAKLDLAFVKRADRSSARRSLAGALVELAHELNCRIVATGIEIDSDLETVCELGVDLGQGPYLGQPTEEMLPVDPRLVQRAAV